MNKDFAQEEEWIRQNHLAYVGLIGAGLVMVQPFLNAASLDLSAKICVVAFAVSIPLLAALVMVSQQESFRRRSAGSALVNLAKPVAQASAFVGVVAGFWHILWFAGVAMLAAGVVALGVHTAGYARLDRGEASASPEAGEAGEA